MRACVRVGGCKLSVCGGICVCAWYVHACVHLYVCGCVCACVCVHAFACVCVNTRELISARNR